MPLEWICHSQLRQWWHCDTSSSAVAGGAASIMTQVPAACGCSEGRSRVAPRAQAAIDVEQRCELVERRSTETPPEVGRMERELSSSGQSSPTCHQSVVMLNLFVNTTCSFCAQWCAIPKQFAQTAARRVAARSLLGVRIVAERHHCGCSRGHVEASR